LGGHTAHQIPAWRPEELLREWSVFQSPKGRFGEHFWRWLNVIDWTERFQVQYV
jgi:hypothetical protein